MHHPLVREALETPYLPGQAAFFDLDRTLVHGFTARAFFGERVKAGAIGPMQAARTVKDALSFESGRMGYSSFLVRASELYAGMPEQELVDLGEKLFQDRIASAVYPESYALVDAHKKAGRPVVVVTSATRYQAEPVARALGADHLLCSRLEVDDDGVLTGRVERPTCFGIGKRRAAEELGEREGITLGESWFYTDGVEDLPLLEAVGNPRPLNPGRSLARASRKRGWDTHTLSSRGVRPTHIVRTAMGLGALAVSVGAGLPVLFGSGDARKARNLSETLFGELGTLFGGIELEVEGEHHVWANRPAVFVFNHQSAVEPLLLCKLLRRDFVGIAKIELKKSVLAPAFDYAGAVYIERMDKKKAVETLQPVVETLKGGTSVIIAPEGTRSPTRYPGPFKKGAFHIARQAGVPIVPICFHNSLDALPRKGRIVHPATIQVTVLPPVLPESMDDVGASAHALRNAYLRTLGFPEEPAED